MKKMLMLLCLFWITGTLADAQPARPLRDLASERTFYVGAAIASTLLEGDEDYGEVVSREFNLITTEWESKMCIIQAERGVYDFRPTDKMVRFAEKHDLTVRGHTLVWHQCAPDWITNGAFTRDQATQLLREYITTVVGHYKGRIAIWDVVNEAFNEDGTWRDTPWWRWLGEDYIELAFRFAHEADPNLKLFYNDYNTETLNAKSDAVYAMVQDFVARGVPIHGVGLQTHLNVGDVGDGKRIDPTSLRANIERLGELGLEVQITEIDIAHKGVMDEALLQWQAGQYRQVFDICLSIEACTGFITWGVADHNSWLRNPEYYDNPVVAPLLFDENYQPKPAYYAIYDALLRDLGEAPILTDEEVDEIVSGVTIEVDIPEPSKSDEAQLAPDSAAGAVYYAAFPVTITLDGDVSDWENVPRVKIDQGPMLPEGSETVMTFAVVADNENLYFLAEVADQKVVYGTHNITSEWYQEDSVEFYINATGDLDALSYAPGIVQLAIPALNIEGKPVIAGGRSGDVSMEVMVIETEDGYLVEASLPLQTDVWSIKPKHGDILGFQAHLNGSSGTGRDTKLIWSVYDTQDQSWQNPSVFGQLIFWDATS